MKSLNVKQLMDIVGGTLVKGSTELEIHDATPYVEYIKQPNTLLFLLRKWRVKWDFLSKWERCVVVTDRVFDELLACDGCTIVQVDNDSEAFEKFINFYRGQFDIPVIAVTGTSGKSTTVGMISHVISKYRKVTHTRNSANGRTSHFMYLMDIDDSTEAAVFETAVGKPGDVTLACSYFKPQIGILTNIGTHHLDDCISQEGYIDAKGELLTSVQEGGLLIINADDELTQKLPIHQFNGRVITVSIEKDATFYASNIQYAENGMNFLLTYNKVTKSFFVPGYGKHQVYNALQSIAALHELGFGFNEISEALKTFKKLPLRLQIKRGLNNCILLDDSWNITTTSLKSALTTLNDISGGFKKVVLLGEIHRTGQNTREVIARYVDLFLNHGMDIADLITIGHTGSLIVHELKEHGFQGNLYTFSDIDGVYELLTNLLDDQTFFLLKVTIEDCPTFISSLISD